MALSSVEFLFRLTATQTGANDFGGPAFTPKMEKRISLVAGTSASQADQLFMDFRSVGDGADDDIDLAGVLTDVFGTTLTMVEMVGLFVINGQDDAAANTTDLTIGIGSNPFVGFLGGTTPTIGPLKPGAAIMLAAGDAAGLGTITATTADILRIGNSAGAANNYSIGIVARSA